LRQSIVIVDAVAHAADFLTKQFIRRFIGQRRRLIGTQRAVSWDAFVVRRTLRLQFVAPLGHAVSRPIDFKGRPVIIRWSDLWRRFAIGR
jgi:hypothetical protein